MCYRAVDKVSDWERAALVRESFWEKMTFELRLENKPATCRETRTEILSSFCWETETRPVLLKLVNQWEMEEKAGDEIRWGPRGPCKSLYS